MGGQRGGPENPRSQPSHIPWRIHGAAIYGNMDPINIPPMLAYIPYMDPMGMLNVWYIYLQNCVFFGTNVGQYSSTMEHMGMGNMGK